MQKRARKRLLEVLVFGFAGFAVLIGFFALVRVLWVQISVPGVFILLTLIAAVPVAIGIRWIQREIVRSGVRTRAADVRSVADMCVMSPTDFEHYVATVYRAMGFHADVTKRSGDNGIDVVLSRGGKKTGVQVKRYAPGNKVGRPEIQKLAE